MKIDITKEDLLKLFGGHNYSSKEILENPKAQVAFDRICNKLLNKESSSHYWKKYLLDVWDESQDCCDFLQEIEEILDDPEFALYKKH